MKKKISYFFLLLKQFNQLIYEHIGNYNIVLAQLSIGFIYGSMSAIFFSYTKSYLFYTIFYGGILLFLTHLLNIITFNIDVIKNITGVSSREQIFNIVQLLIDSYPIELISFIFFFIFFFFLIKKYG